MSGVAHALAKAGAVEEERNGSFRAHVEYRGEDGRKADLRGPSRVVLLQAQASCAVSEKSCTIWPECKKSHTVCPKQKSPVLSGLNPKSHILFAPSRKVLYCLAWVQKDATKNHVLLGSSKKSYALFRPKRCGPCKQPVHTELSKMLACNFLLKILSGVLREAFECDHLL